MTSTCTSTTRSAVFSRFSKIALSCSIGASLRPLASPGARDTPIAPRKCATLRNADRRVSLACHLRPLSGVRPWTGACPRGSGPTGTQSITQSFAAEYCLAAGLPALSTRCITARPGVAGIRSAALLGLTCFHRSAVGLLRCDVLFFGSCLALCRFLGGCRGSSLALGRSPVFRLAAFCCGLGLHLHGFGLRARLSALARASVSPFSPMPTSLAVSSVSMPVARLSAASIRGRYFALRAAHTALRTPSSP